MFNPISRSAGARLMAAAVSAVMLSAPALAQENRTQCGPRNIAQNLKEAVLAMKAAQYCEGMPYTIGEAAARVEAMRCNDQASTLIDELLNDFSAEYEAVFAADAGDVVCTQAAAIDLQMGS